MTRETVLSLSELTDLLDYSHSIPTGQTVGKRWKRQTRGGDWLIGEYYTTVKLEAANRIGIHWTWAVLAPGVPHRVEAAERHA